MQKDRTKAEGSLDKLPSDALAKLGAQERKEEKLNAKTFFRSPALLLIRVENKIKKRKIFLFLGVRI